LKKGNHPVFSVRHVEDVDLFTVDREAICGH
jgi:hypothetical protein